MIVSNLNKKKISLIILLFINFIFSIKYLSRYTFNYLAISLLITSIQVLTIYKFDFIQKLLVKTKIKSIYLLIFSSIILLLIASKIPIESLKVDRWSVITSFWDNYFNNKYAYYAKSFDGNYPGPMPIYFVLFLPFYFIKEFSYITIMGLFLFYTILKKNHISEKNKNLYVIFISTSLFIIWESLSRSNIFFNGALILSVTLYFLNFNNTKKALLCKGILIGLVLSTRNVFIIVFAIAFIYSILNKKYSFRELFQMGFITIITFIITFLPFVYNHFKDFLQMNPFIIQSSALMPSKYSFLCIFLSILITLKIKSSIDVIFYSGIMLFFTITTYFLYTIVITNFNTAFFESKADISYFIFCIPFFLYYFLILENIEK